MYEKLPEQLKKDGRFCLWKYEKRNGRMTKVPYQTNGKRASSADKNTFSDFRMTIDAMDGYDGIGMGAFDDFCMSILTIVCWWKADTDGRGHRGENEFLYRNQSIRHGSPHCMYGFFHVL